MSRAPLTNTRLAAAGAIVLTAIALSCLSVGGLGSPPTAGRDDWRRTAHGWERTTAWRISAAPDRKINPAQTSKKAAKYTRFDTHPAALAFVQLIGALTALAAFPPHP